MLHCGLLTHADDLWRAFFEGLELVVVDEDHEYRGVFGSHVGLVLRRLARLCDRFETELQFVCCSGTIGNPREHAATVTGQSADSFRLVEEDASEDQLDQYVINHPNELFEGTPERAVADPTNPHLLRLHAHAAAVEQPITTDDETYFGPTFPGIVSSLTEKGR
ncbi:MAG: ATP-dependent helicase YprA (DUF1998 family) [Natronomonas sp.]|jgi:ATP-dependent helicase YprA (DUF1998 family)